MSNPSVQVVPSLAHTPSHDHGGHVVQLYTDDGFLIDVLSRFSGGALAVGDVAVVVATAAHRIELERRLSGRGVDINKVVAQGRYIVLDASETLPRFMVNGAVDESRFKATIGGVLKQATAVIHGEDCRIAVFGELVALLWAQGKPQEAIRVEQFWNDLAKTYSFSLLCAYPIAGFDNERHIAPFLKMCSTHSGVVPSESYLGLSSEDDRLRSVAELQQKAEVLEKELARRDSEEQFRLLVATVQDYAIFMLDPSGNVSTWNAGAERIKQYKAEEIIGKHFSQFYPQEDVRNGKPDWELTVAEKQGRIEDEGWRVRKDGSRFWANVIITAVRDSSGKLVGFAKVTRDVTAKMQAQQALQKEVAERREAQKQLRLSEKSLRELSLYLLATQDEERRRIGRDLHDSLGQYLAVLKMKLDFIASVLGKNEEIAQDVSQCIRLTEDSIKEVRTVSYLLYPPMLEEMGLKSAIPWYLDGFSSRSGIKTTFVVEADFNRLPRDRELALFRVLQESLTNVHRHSESKTAAVRLLTRDGMGILEIEDSGKGISQQLLEQAGQDWDGCSWGWSSRHERAHAAIGRHARTRVEPKRHDSAGEDAPYNVAFYAIILGPEAVGIPLQPAKKNYGEYVLTKIVIVDDHEIVREGIRTLITRSRPEWNIVGEASSGTDAIEICKTLKPDVLVLDITMPGMSGLEAALKIAESELPCRVF